MEKLFHFVFSLWLVHLFPSWFFVFDFLFFILTLLLYVWQIQLSGS